MQTGKSSARFARSGGSSGADPAPGPPRRPPRPCRKGAGGSVCVSPAARSPHYSARRKPGPCGAPPLRSGKGR